MAQVKTYVLLDHLNATAPVFQHVGHGERAKIEKRPNLSVTLRQSFIDKDGIAHTIRFKHGSKFIDQSEQVEKEKIDANAPFSAIERSLRHFKNGSLTTNNVAFQNYLEAHPGWWKFEGHCEDFKNVRSYKLLEPEVDAQVLNKEFKRQLAALNKVASLNKGEADSLLLKVYGSFYNLPENLDDSQNALIQFVNDCDANGLEMVISTETDADTETNVLIGLLINKGLLSYEANLNSISLKRNGEWQKVKEISSEHTPEDRHMYFVEFVTSQAGELVLKEMKNMAKTDEQAKEEVKEVKDVSEEAVKEEEKPKPAKSQKNT